LFSNVHKIKNFLAPKIKTQFEPMFLTGSLAVFIGAAEPRLRAGLPRRRKRRKPFELSLKYSTSKELASQRKPPRFARRPIRIEFWGQKTVRDFAFGARKFLIQFV
jgi:hypothetical protein